MPWCDFATLTSTVVDSSGSLLVETRLGFGLWRYQTFTLQDGGLYIENSCTGYDPSMVDIDSAWKAARAFGCLALIIGGLNLMNSYWQVNRSDEERRIGATQPRISGAVFIVASFYQGLTLFFLRSSICKRGGESKFQEELELSLHPAVMIYDDKCTLSTGANMTIASTICWFVAGIFSCMANPPKSPEFIQCNDAYEVEAAADESDNDVKEVDDAEKPADSACTAIIICADEKEGDGGGDQEEQKDYQTEQTKLESQKMPRSDVTAKPEKQRPPGKSKTGRRRYRS